MLVATQVTAVTVLMFVGVLSAVMARRVVNLDPGYDPTRLLQATLSPSSERFPSSADRARVFLGVQSQLAAHGAVESTMLRTKLAEHTDAGGAFALRATSPGATLPSATVVATLGALATLGIEGVDGRAPSASDDETRASVAVISRSLAAKHWPGRSPIGDQLRLAGVGDTAQWRTIVGVVSDLPYGNLLSRDRSPDAIYLPLLQAGVNTVDALVRHRASELEGRQALLDVTGAIDPSLIPGQLYRTAEVIQKSGLIVTGLTKMFLGCFVFALLLAVAGTYGLMSRSIGLRTREIGVRRALGASDENVTRMLLTQGARQLGVGTLVAAPLIAIVGATTAHYFPVSGVLTALIGVIVSVAIIAVVLLATWLPARRVVGITLRDALGRE